MGRPPAYRRETDAAEYRRAADCGMHLANIGVDMESVREFCRYEWRGRERFQRKCIKAAERMTIAFAADRTGQAMTTDRPVDLRDHRAPSSLLLQ